VAGFITGKSRKTRQEQQRVAELGDADKARYYAQQAELLANNGAGELANMYSALAAAFGAVAINDALQTQSYPAQAAAPPAVAPPPAGHAPPDAGQRVG
jgi:hypothetical protein